MNEEVKPVGKYAPLSAWAYFGYQVLFAIPVIGFICLIVFSFVSDNLNRRSFARSYWCALLVGIIALAVSVIILYATGAMQEIMTAVDAALQSM